MKVKIPKSYSQEAILEILMKFRAPLIIAFITVMVSTVGYMIISKVSLLEALYMTVLTVTTIGYGEIWNMGGKERVFNLIVMTLGVGSVMGYSLAVLINIVTSGELKKIVRFRKMLNDIENLKMHYLVFGSNPYVVDFIRKLHSKKIPYVLIPSGEKAEKIAAHILDLDPMNDDTLYLANVKGAAGAIVATLDDFKNLGITFAISQVVKKENLTPFFLICVANDKKFKEKMLTAGATHVEVIPSVVSGRLCEIASKPSIFSRSLLRDIIFGEETEIDIDEFLVLEKSPIAGKTIGEIDFRKKLNLMILAIRRSDGTTVNMPSSSERLKVGDVILVAGREEDLRKAEGLLFSARVIPRRYSLKKSFKEREDGLE